MQNRIVFNVRVQRYLSSTGTPCNITCQPPKAIREVRPGHEALTPAVVVPDNTHTHTHTPTHTHTHPYAHLHTHTPTHTSIRTLTHTYTHTHTHSHTHRCLHRGHSRHRVGLHVMRTKLCALMLAACLRSVT